MKVFITGTDTNIGKTLISSWICLHTGYSYFKPIQTGTIDGEDKDAVTLLSETDIYPEVYSYPDAISPHLAASLQKESIEMSKIKLPKCDNLIVEGAGGVLVPINQENLMVDLMSQLNIPVILIASTRLGTINHTLLSLEALQNRKIRILGVILNGENVGYEIGDSIEYYGNTKILAQFPYLERISKELLQEIPLGKNISQMFGA